MIGLIHVISASMTALLSMVVLSTIAFFIPRFPWFRRYFIPDVAVLLLLGVISNILFPALHTLVLTITHRSWLTMAASLLIFYGGAELTHHTMRLIWKPVALLAVLGVLVSALMLGILLFTFSVAHLPLAVDVLIGAILAGTDPTVLISLLDVVSLQARMKELLIAESALNDPVSALLATSLLTALTPHASLTTAVLLLLWQVGSAIFASMLLSYLIKKIQSTLSLFFHRHQQPSATRIRIDVLSLRVFSIFIFTSLTSSILHSSPFLMAFFMGFMTQPLVQTHSTAPQRVLINDTTEVQSDNHSALPIILFTVRSYLFLSLGLSFPLHASLQEWLYATVTAILLITVARPLSVLAVKGVLVRDFPLREAGFCACNRQTGVIPALFASELLRTHMAHSHYIDLVVTIAILATSVFLLPAFLPLARLFRVTDE